jgi:GT2 family glycosyltransferase
MKGLPEAKDWLRDRLPPATRLFLKRLISRTRNRNRGANNWTTEQPLLNVEGWSAQDFLARMRSAGPPPAPRIRDTPARTSIIIPVFNKIEFTFHCLQSLLAEIELKETEVIVVDDGSTDETREVLSYFRDSVRVVESRDNRGFVGACNQGAAAAGGDFLVFLNNDTIVLPGWLQHLLDTIEKDETVGAVGSLFLYPDGSIQEAGGIVWSSGEAYHYGWGRPLAEPQYLFAREVDFCSGASLLIRSELFRELGGFDERYAPAYYEDVDLCFGVRSLGRKVMYQPASRIIHYEGATTGRDVNTSVKRYQLVNQAKFHEKWLTVLERDHFSNHTKQIAQAANRKAGPEVIVFDDRVPTPDRDAGSARMLSILKILARHSRVVFVYLTDQFLQDYEELLWREGIETAPIVDYPRLLQERNFQAAIISRPHVAAAVLQGVRRRSKKTKIIFDMVDAHYLRLGLEYQLTGNKEIGREAERYHKLELALSKASDLVWCASVEEKKAVSVEAPGTAIEVIPTIHSLHPTGKSFDERANLLFIGNFSHSPNRDALKFFVQQIFPLVRQSLPDVKFAAIGSNAPLEFQAYASAAVTFHGYVPDVDPLFNEARVFVAPLRFGAGVKGKIGEALAYGVPVVTTPIGAEGMGFENGQQALIATTPEAFAAAVVQVYRERELWQRLSVNGRAHIAAHFSPEVMEQTILAAIAPRA